jgi:hypothetical protein
MDSITKTDNSIAKKKKSDINIGNVVAGAVLVGYAAVSTAIGASLGGMLGSAEARAFNYEATVQGI